jgi:lipopolysaccharide export system permease protein
MLKIYQKYLIQIFFRKFFLITLIFLTLVVILSSLEEISFTKNLDLNFLYPYFLTLLNSPITLFEIFPFILLLTTQFLFYDLFRYDELNLLKANGLNNISIIKIIFLLSILIGLFNIIFFYNFASNLKFEYSNLKNRLSDDNKYLAMVTKSGLWIKDEIGDKKMIIKSNLINENFIFKTIINEFDKNFNLIRVIQSEKIDITKNLWIVYNPVITKNNITIKNNEKLTIKTNFNYDKISKIFSNISTLDLYKLLNLKKDYEKLGYSSDEITIHLYKLFAIPLIYGILVVMASIIMLNISRGKSIILYTTTGFLISIIIYYFMFFFSSLGENGKIPLELSIFFPILILLILCSIGLVNINEK